MSAGRESDRLRYLRLGKWKIIQKSNEFTCFQKINPQTSHTVLFQMTILPNCWNVMDRISVHVETHTAVRHCATAFCNSTDVIKVLSALLQYAKSWSVDQPPRKCKRLGWTHKTPQYVGCDWFTLHPAGALCVVGDSTKLGQTHEINWRWCAYVNAYCQGLILTDCNM